MRTVPGSAGDVALSLIRACLEEAGLAALPEGALVAGVTLTITYAPPGHDNEHDPSTVTIVRTATLDLFPQTIALDAAEAAIRNARQRLEIVR